MQQYRHNLSADSSNSLNQVEVAFSNDRRMIWAPRRAVPPTRRDLSQRNRLACVMTEEASIKKFDGLPPLVRCIHTNQGNISMMQYLPFLDELLKVDACILAEDEEHLVLTIRISLYLPNAKNPDGTIKPHEIIRARWSVSLRKNSRNLEDRQGYTGTSRGLLWGGECAKVIDGRLQTWAFIEIVQCLRTTKSDLGFERRAMSGVRF